MNFIFTNFKIYFIKIFYLLECLDDEDLDDDLELLLELLDDLESFLTFFLSLLQMFLQTDK